MMAVILQLPTAGVGTQNKTDAEASLRHLVNHMSYCLKEASFKTTRLSATVPAAAGCAAEI